MPYYPQANGIAESTNKILQTILKKIINENCTGWDEKLHSTIWAYRTTFKMSIQSTPFRMTFGMEAVILDTQPTSPSHGKAARVLI